MGNHRAEIETVIRREIITRSAWWTAAVSGTLSAVEASSPEPGYYRTKLMAGGDQVRVRIWAEREFDDAGDQTEDDRLFCTINGIESDVADVWPWCARTPITVEQYAALSESAGKSFDFRVVEIKRLPDDLLMPATRKIRTLIAAGSRSIPGVEIFEVKEIVEEVNAE